jgi:probable lipoprotein NlpC
MQMEIYKKYCWIIICTIFFTSCASSKKMAVRQQQVDKLVYTARSYKGTPYKWGGVNRQGLDCSGLLYCSFNAIGKDLPRTSEAQKSTGKKIKIKHLQPGDLLFFATGKKKRKVTHVGLVTEVKKPDQIYFIHSSTSRGVVESNLFQDYYIKRFRVARRVF